MPNPDVPPQDGRWDGTKGINSPKIEGTGLTPVYYSDVAKQWVPLTSISTKDEWDNWYDYDNQKWANARTADGSMWVWIPRYEYKIDSTAKTIDVRFIKTDVKKGTNGYITDVTGITTSADGYIVHPAFIDDSVNEFNNGGWDSEIEGFWVAKYPAGWQNGQGTNLGSSVDMSNITYKTSGSSNTYAGTISNNSTKMSYPEFKANNYVYNYISVGDAYAISQDIKNAERYGLNSTVDSHLEKNSEWGAVAYLAHSKYGVNGQDIIAKNTTNRGNSPTGIYAVTGLESTVNMSTTQNITGVYDLSGCVWEQTATFLKEASETRYIAGMLDNSSILVSNKYVTIYEGIYDTSNKTGDAVKEISTNGNSNSGSWNNDYSYFIKTYAPVFVRGGYFYESESDCGVFAFGGCTGCADNNSGFRVVLVLN